MKKTNGLSPISTIATFTKTLAHVWATISHKTNVLFSDKAITIKCVNDKSKQDLNQIMTTDTIRLFHH